MNYTAEERRDRTKFEGYRQSLFESSVITIYELKLEAFIAHRDVNYKMRSLDRSTIYRFYRTPKLVDEINRTCSFAW